jgi:hypothetical protein
MGRALAKPIDHNTTIDPSALFNHHLKIIPAWSIVHNTTIDPSAPFNHHIKINPASPIIPNIRHHPIPRPQAHASPG